MLQEVSFVSFVEWGFVASEELDVASKNDTMRRSDGSLHTMELRLKTSVTPPALGCMLCRRGVVLKQTSVTPPALRRMLCRRDVVLQSAPCSGSRS